MRTLRCPTTGLELPAQFVDEKEALKKTIDEWLENAVNSLKHIKRNYFLTLHAKFDKFDPSLFTMNAPVVTYRIPPFTSNQMVWWINPTRGICELLWMVPPKKRGEKLKVEFNTKGVAYLQAKGAMPSQGASLR